MNALLLAISFLTVIPARVDGAESRMGRAVAFFPAAGLVIGGLLCLADFLLAKAVSPAVGNMLLVLFLVLLTNGLHLDGFADTADGLGGGTTAERALEIMKDSRVGTYGVAAVFFDLGLKYLLLGELAPEIKPFVLLAFPVLSRWSMAISLTFSPSPRGKSGLAGWLGGRSKLPNLLFSTVLTIGIAIAAVGVRAVPALGLALAIAACAILYFKKRLGGMTGDSHGALNEVVEMAVLLLFGVLARTV